MPTAIRTRGFHGAKMENAGARFVFSPCATKAFLGWRGAVRISSYFPPTKIKSPSSSRGGSALLKYQNAVILGLRLRETAALIEEQLATSAHTNPGQATDTSLTDTSATDSSLTDSSLTDSSSTGQLTDRTFRQKDSSARVHFADRTVRRQDSWLLDLSPVPLSC